MKQSTISIIIILTSLCFNSCTKEEHAVDMWIAAEKRIGYDDENGVERPYIMYKIKEYKDWAFFNGQIDGFEYEEGYEYHLLVHPKKHSYIELYGLIKVITKEKK